MQPNYIYMFETHASLTTFSMRRWYILNMSRIEYIIKDTILLVNITFVHSIC